MTHPSIIGYYTTNGVTKMEVIIDRGVRRRRRLVRLFFRLVLLGIVLFLAAAVGLLSYTKMQGPPPLSVTKTSIFYGADGTPIGEHHQGEIGIGSNCTRLHQMC